MKRPVTFAGCVALAIAAFGVIPARADDGLPQLDTSLYPEQLFWLAIAFSALYLVMRFVALPGVQATQDKRKDVIDAELNAARQANEEAKAMGHESDRALAEARSKATATITDIKTQTAKLAAEQQAAQSKQLGQKMRDAEAKILAARDAALKEIDASAGDLASAIVEKVSGLKVKA